MVRIMDLVENKNCQSKVRAECFAGKSIKKTTYGLWDNTRERGNDMPRRGAKQRQRAARRTNRLLKDKVVAHYPGAVFLPVAQQGLGTCFRIKLNHGIMSVQKNMSWTDIKRKLDILSDPRHTSELCTICCDGYTATGCNKCSFRYCLECYIRLFESGQGIIKCPNCRDSIGRPYPPHMIPYAIMDIRKKFELLRAEFE